MTIAEVFADHSAVTARAALELPPVLERAVTTMHEALRAGGKILACGNGGSAADAQHLSAELVGRFREERQALPAIALTADTALLMAFSTSGNSPNVVQAAQTARRLGCTVVAFTGARGGELASHADVLLKAPSNTVARIQEVHTLCIHVLCESLDALIRAEQAT